MATPSLSTKAARQADKQISLLSIMAKLGHAPVGQAAGGNYYFLSPFREEKTPSFVVSGPKNVWADFGEAPDPGKKVAGGDVLKLVQKLTGFDLPLARLTLRAWASDLATPQELALPPEPELGLSYSTGRVTFSDVRVEPISYRSLLQYLASRGINWESLHHNPRTRDHLQQISYRTSTSTRPQPYFGLGWKTEAGWEVRSKGFQGTIGGKGLTWLLGSKRDEVMVFEGFMDYLSALTYYRHVAFAPTVLILNSVSLLGEALPTLQQAKLVHWFGDNDAAGERALDWLRKVLTRARVKAHNDLYRGYKDFNDFLTKTPPTKPLPPKRAELSQLALTCRYWLWVEFTQPDAKGKPRQCTFYGWTNDATGLEMLRVLRNRLGHQLAYYRLCERSTGRQFKILEWAGLYSPLPKIPKID